jgi:predicted dehydrogenase
MTTGKKARVGMCGLGSFSYVIGNTVQRSSKLELVTCFDPVAERRAATSARYGCSQETSFEAMVKRPDLDGVLLVSPNMFHREQAELAAQHGKHVYVEKPIANTMDDGRKMIAACEKAGVTLLIGHVHRRHAANRKVKELVDSGALGKLIMVEANLSSGQGWELQPDEFRWRDDDTGCPGGALMTIGVHQADTLNYIFGPIKTVFSFFNHLHIPAPACLVISVPISPRRAPTGCRSTAPRRISRAPWRGLIGSSIPSARSVLMNRRVLIW